MTLIFAPEFDGTDSKKVTASVQKLLGSTAKIKEVKSIGKKPLAYPIGKKSEAFYVEVALEADALRVSEIQKVVESSADVMRFLLLAA